MSQERVVVVGDALIDELRDDLGVREFVGGAALNVAVGLARLGVPTALIAMVGDDEAGARIAAYLSDFDVELIASPSPHGSSRAISVRGPGGEPTYAFNEAAQGRRIRFGDRERAAIERAPVTVVSCFPFDDAPQAAEFAETVAASDTKLVVDPNPRSGMMRDLDAFVAGFERIVPRTTLVKIGDDDAALMYAAVLDDAVVRVRGLGAPAVLVTRGADGAAIVADGVEVAAPITALRGRVVDTMGAGDASLSAAVAALAGADAPNDEGSWQAVLEDAMAIAAATCRFEGALLRTPAELRGADIDAIGT